ncbi:hydroxyisourate hydrolase [Neisseriaceae bacterium B2N2-7]|uniref:5-hydroxyisourate hydrolase n=2 Tax=Craterilacuibacter sinensis TaxID=2686017 RepID=A0A845BSA0_9NEIS|nr:hydroxyisourate hydrolase [Craterilacuibacter sinensis]
MGKLTTHILDTSRGLPAAGIPVILLQDGQVLASAHSNADGRLDIPLLQGHAWRSGRYTLRFLVTDYLGAKGCIPFFDLIDIHFLVDDSAPSLHLPLLLSPYGYSTYRGS